MRLHKILALIAACVAIALNAEANIASAELLHGELRREVVNPWAQQSLIGWGLATDSEYLYASSNRDGVIRIIDIQSLSILDTIGTPAVGIRGLTYRDGLLYGVASQDPDVSRFFTVDLTSRSFNWTFDAPSRGLSEISFGPDGLLYAVDGFEVGADGTRIYGFDSVSGSILRTLRPRIIGEPPDDGDEIGGTSMLEWLPGGQLLIDFRVGFQNLSLPEIENDVLIPGAVLDVPGLELEPRRGAAVAGNTLYLWGFAGGSVGKFYEIQIVPEPSGGVLVGAGAIAALAFALLRTRPSQQHAVVRGIRSA